MVNMRLRGTLKGPKGLGSAAQWYNMCTACMMTSAQPQHTYKNHLRLVLGKERVWPGTFGTKPRHFKFFSFTVNATTEIFVPRRMVVNICYSYELL